MNVQRFFTLPNAFKPLSLIFVMLAMLLAASAPFEDVDASLESGWFFWLNIILQLVWFAIVCGLFLNEAEIFLSCGHDTWPVVEMTYCCICFLCNIINTFILAGWNQYSPPSSNTFMMAALTTFLLVIFNGMSGLMMFRIWNGFVKSGASQNPTPNLQPGNIGGMHPGI